MDKKPEVSLSIRLQLDDQKPVNNLPVNGEAPMMETMESLPKLHPVWSGSDHMNLLEFTSDKEVQSKSKWDDFDQDREKGFDFSMAGLLGEDDLFETRTQLQINQFSPLQDMFLFPSRNPEFF